MGRYPQHLITGQDNRYVCYYRADGLGAPLHTHPSVTEAVKDQFTSLPKYLANRVLQNSRGYFPSYKQQAKANVQELFSKNV